MMYCGAIHSILQLSWHVMVQESLSKARATILDAQQDRLNEKASTALVIRSAGNIVLEHERAGMKKFNQRTTG
ncbi:hypothetical protein E8L03_11190 [Oceanidesulfovibrio marinus]|uniref:Uncharacterized protein n=1 Tax=Oceanidesulfovibrio marinus TaxID=370038 RepID=A0ABX6NFS9_9BACT|nr:hypothetical protein E8L03_11190 [Oceanidesulfovibrio marinus]